MSAASAGREAEALLLRIFATGPARESLNRALSRAHRRREVAVTLVGYLPLLRIGPDLVVGSLRLTDGRTVAEVVQTDHVPEVLAASPLNLHDEQVVETFVEEVETFLATIPLPLPPAPTPRPRAVTEES